MKIELKNVMVLFELSKEQLQHLLKESNKEALKYFENYKKSAHKTRLEYYDSFKRGFISYDQYLVMIQKEKNNFHPYKDIQDTEIWKQAQRVHIALNQKKFGKVTCEFCKKHISVFSNEYVYCTLHHEKYGDHKYFSDCVIVHDKCHKKIHNA